MTAFLAAHGIIFLYLLVRLVLPLRTPGWLKGVIALILLLISQQYLVRFALGNLGSPEMPAALLMLQGGSFAAVLIMFVLVALTDLAVLVRFVFRRKNRDRRRFYKEKSFSPGRRLALTALLGAIPAAYGVRQAVAIPGVNRTEARIPRLPAELDGLTLVQITDLHASALLQKGWVDAVVDAAAGLDADVIFFTGDMVDGELSRRSAALDSLGRLRARLGVYGCVGNHEYYSGFADWTGRFSALGVTMLLNSHALIPVGGATMAIAGLTDMVAKDFGLPLPDRAAALSGVPRDAFRIMLDHRPTNALLNAEAGVDLQLSGHTHGGHALGMDRLVGRFNGGFVRGWYTVDGMALYVSSGAGLWNGFPIRLGVPSEIAHMTLRRA